MRPSIALGSLAILISLTVAGCGTGSRLDIEAAREEVRHFYCASHVTLDYDLIEGPEYAEISKIPRDHLASWAADRSAACGVRVKFTWRTGNWTTHDDWVVWVSSEHKGVGYSPNPLGDNWRQFVQSVASGTSAAGIASR